MMSSLLACMSVNLTGLAEIIKISTDDRMVTETLDIK